jgi:hypothetical protein
LKVIGCHLTEPSEEALCGKHIPENLGFQLSSGMKVVGLSPSYKFAVAAI